jgi:hypothetical protein
VKPRVQISVLKKNRITGMDHLTFLSMFKSIISFKKEYQRWGVISSLNEVGTVILTRN